MSARDKHEPTSDAGILSSWRIPNSQTIGQSLALMGESIYAGLGITVPACHDDQLLFAMAEPRETRVAAWVARRVRFERW
jgi:hypothetical protein